MEYKMKKYIKKLFYSSVIALVGAEINFDTEARVTREVAEATLPYLMEAAGIHGDPDEEGVIRAKETKYKNVKIKAILDMIYTDEGQREMVNWVKTGAFPSKLSDAGFVSVGTYADESYRKVSLASLFPCQTGTFTSFANHESRLGKHLLSIDSAQRLGILKKIFHKNLDVESILPNLNYTHMHNVDCIIAKIVFVLEICDETTTIANLIFPQKVATDFIKRMKGIPSNSEYLCRPVSAIAARNVSEEYEGDCTETLYKHLINIAIQDEKNLNKFHIDKIPESLRRYYSSKSQPIELKGTTYAGETSIVRHDNWKEQLLNFLTKQTISCYQSQLTEAPNGIIATKIIPTIAFSKDNTLALEKFLSIGSVQNMSVVLASIASSPIVPDNTTDTIKGALNSLSSSKDKQFEVEVIHLSKSNKNYPWMTNQIIISEKVKGVLKRTITIGTCENSSDTNQGHSEIISITLH